MTRHFTVKTALTDYFNGTISLGKLYKLIEHGEIPHVRVGTRIILREDLLDQWMLQQPTTKGGTHEHTH